MRAADADRPPTVVVVAAALLDGEGRLLGARRSAPPSLAGRWELPGGKVEAGETDEAALRRECREELGVEVELAHRVGGEWPLSAAAVLRVWQARIVTGVPRPLQDHSELRWLPPGSWLSLDWLPGDIEPIRTLLRAWNPES